MIETGSMRAARDLRVGDHVRLPDGRWPQITDITVTKTAPNAPAVVAAGLLVDYRDTEGACWAPGDAVFSRSPAEQVEYVETVIGDLREKALAAGGAA